jgi:DNA (cytosine-5)-methyltransferase 1
MSILQGFPRNYKFIASARSNIYRHIGDAVPPLISYQLAKVSEWILSGQRPSIDSVILPHTHLTLGDIEAAPEKQPNFELSASAPALI